ncbi:hypothetical protein KX816_12430 [Sphingosinicellaceae bacterium]|nr:hypothetical protein KX816_12430 [Sphingosinicellaceae bacterium]
MRPFLPLAVAAFTLAAGAGHAAPRLSPEAQIAKALVGRVAGKPTDCILQRNIRSTQIIGGTAILYEMNGGVIYLNRVASGGSFLHSDLALVTDTHSPQLCSIDIVRLYDTLSRFERGTVGLGPFVPYTKPGRTRGM